MTFVEKVRSCLLPRANKIQTDWFPQKYVMGWLFCGPPRICGWFQSFTLAVEYIFHTLVLWSLRYTLCLGFQAWWRAVGFQIYTQSTDLIC